MFYSTIIFAFLIAKRAIIISHWF